MRGNASNQVLCFQIFHGELTQKITCSCCGIEMATDEAFWHLPIALVDSDREHYSVVWIWQPVN